MSKPLSTIRDIVEQKPEWLDLPLTVMKSDGELEYLSGSLGIFPSKDDEDANILVLALN